MTIPNEFWIKGFGQKPLPDYDVTRPPSPPYSIYAEALGGSILGSADTSLTKKWWLVYQLGGNVVIDGSANGVYDGSPTTIFQELVQISEISLALDQQNRPVVFYRLTTDEIKLYWFDPLISQYTITVIGNGKNPKAAFDYPTHPSETFTDVLLFYIATDGTVKWLEQRDRYQTPRTIPNVVATKLIEVGLTVENRFQVSYLKSS